MMKKLFLSFISACLLSVLPAMASGTYTTNQLTVNDIEGNTIYVGTATSGQPFVQFNSTTSGVLFPEVTTTQMNAISGAQLGEMLFNTSNTNYYFYNGSGWATIGSATTSGSTLLAGNGTGGISNVTIGSGLTYNSGSTTLSLSTTSWVPNNIQVFTSSGTWTQPAGITKCYVKVIGPGGAGGGGSSTSTTGGGGGGGGYSEGIISVTGNVTVTIGSTNSFAGSTTISATSGAAGSAPVGGNPGIGGTGGTGSGGTINISGGPGQKGGSGGSTMMGSGGYSIAGSFSNSGNSFGGGGGGGIGSSGSGGSGDPGGVIIYY